MNLPARGPKITLVARVGVFPLPDMGRIKEQPARHLDPFAFELLADLSRRPVFAGLLLQDPQARRDFHNDPLCLFDTSLRPRSMWVSHASGSVALELAAFLVPLLQLTTNPIVPACFIL